MTACQRASAGGKSPPADTEPFVLTLQQPVLVRSINHTGRDKKFIQIDINRVENPALLPIAFSVYYRSTTIKKIFLGTFSLFPPDNPGKFLVATRGKLAENGEIVINLVPLEKSTKNHRVRIKVKNILFVDALQ